MANLRDLWKEVCETEQRSSKRNEKLLRDLDELEECVMQMSIKTDQLRRVREHYLNYGEQFRTKPLTSTPQERPPRHLIQVEHVRTGDETYLPHELRGQGNREMSPTDTSTFRIPLKQNIGPVLERVDSLPPSGSRRTSLNSSANQLTRRQSAQLKNSPFVHEETFPSGPSLSPFRNTQKLASKANPLQNNVNVQEQSKEAVLIERRVSLNLNEVAPQVTPPPRTSSRVPSRSRPAHVDVSTKLRLEGNRSEMETKSKGNEEVSTKQKIPSEIIVPKRKDTEENALLMKNDNKSETTGLKKMVQIVDSDEKYQNGLKVGSKVADVASVVSEIRIQELETKEMPTTNTSEEEDSLNEQITSAFVFKEKLLDFNFGHPSVAEESSDEDDIEKQMSASAWTASKITNPKIEKMVKMDKEEKIVTIRDDKKVDLTKKLVERMGLIKEPPGSAEQINKEDEDDKFDFYD